MTNPESTPRLFDNPPTTTTKSAWAPTLLVCVPRAVCDQYWVRPWADVLAAAEAGRDGLTIERVVPYHWLGHEGEKNPRPDVAFLREGDGRSKGRTLLYQQNWGKDEPIANTGKRSPRKRVA